MLAPVVYVRNHSSCYLNRRHYILQPVHSLHFSFRHTQTLPLIAHSCCQSPARSIPAIFNRIANSHMIISVEVWPQKALPPPWVQSPHLIITHLVVQPLCFRSRINGGPHGIIAVIMFHHRTQPRRGYTGRINKRQSPISEHSARPYSDMTSPRAFWGLSLNRHR